MNPVIDELRKERLHKAEVDAQLAKSDAILQGLSKLDATTVQAFSALIQFMQGHTTRTEVVNQLQAIETPGTEKAVNRLMSAVNDMHSSLKKKDVDLSPLAEGLASIFSELQKLPKELPEQKDSFHLENISELLEKFDSLEDSIQKLADKELPTPEVTVQPTDVTVQPADVVVESDFTTLEKQLKDVVKAVKGIVFPDVPKTDLTKVEKELKTANKTLKEIAEKPMGGGGGGGHTTPYINSEGNPVYVEQSLDLQVDDTGTYTYLGNATPGTATSEAKWRIKRVTNATGVITHADGSSLFNKTWTARAGYTY